MAGGTRHFGRAVVTWEEPPDAHPAWHATAEVTRITVGDEATQDDDGAIGYPMPTSTAFVSGTFSIPHDPDGGPNPVAAVYAALDDACAKAGVHITTLEDDVVVVFTPGDIQGVHRMAQRWARTGSLQPVAASPSAGPGNFLAALAAAAKRHGVGVVVEADGDVTPAVQPGQYL